MNNELEVILKNFKGFTPDELYDDLTIIPNKNSQFNEEEFKRFIISFSLLNGTNTDISFENLKDYWEKLSRVNLDKLEKMKNNLEKYFTHWIPIATNTAKEIERNIKIYLSVDNSSLHLFVNKFLLKCLSQDLKDYSFKVNNNQFINRRDNIVIHCNVENVGIYLRLVQEVIKENPNIIFNSPHLLGIPYDNNIFCGVDYENGSISYTDRLCEKIFESLKEGYSPEKIANVLNYKKEKLAPNIYALVENNKTK